MTSESVLSRDSSILNPKPQVVSIFIKPKPKPKKKAKTGKKKFGRGGDAEARLLVLQFKKFLFASDKKAIVQ